MNKAIKTSRKSKMTRLAVVGLVWAMAITIYCLPWTRTEAAANTRPVEQIYKRPVPAYDLNLARHLQNSRQATIEATTATVNTSTSAKHSPAFLLEQESSWPMPSGRWGRRRFR